MWHRTSLKLIWNVGDISRGWHRWTFSPTHMVLEFKATSQELNPTDSRAIIYLKALVSRGGKTSLGILMLVFPLLHP